MSLLLFIESLILFLNFLQTFCCFFNFLLWQEGVLLPLRKLYFQDIKGFFVLFEDKVSLGKTNFMFLFLIVYHFQSFFQFLFQLFSTFHLIFSLLSHTLKRSHHFNLLLQSSHLNFNFNRFLFKLSFSQRFWGNQMRFIFTQLMLHPSYDHNYI